MALEYVNFNQTHSPYSPNNSSKSLKGRGGGGGGGHLFAGLVSEEDAIVEGFRLAFLLDLDLREVQSSAGE